jgi:hypothetical protein
MSGAANLRIDCPHCQKTLSIKAEMAGRRVRCPKCSAIIEPKDLGSALKAPRERSRRGIAFAVVSGLLVAALGGAVAYAWQRQSEVEAVRALAAKAEQDARTDRVRSEEWKQALEETKDRLAAMEMRAQEAERANSAIVKLQVENKSLQEALAVLQAKSSAVPQPPKTVPKVDKPAEIVKDAPTPKKDNVAASEKDLAEKQEKPAANVEKSPASAQKVWEQAKAAQLVVSFGGVLDGASADVKLDEKDFPPLPLAAQPLQDHLILGAEAARKKDVKLARLRGVAEASLGLTSSDWTLHVFADSEDNWPTGRLPLKLRVHGLRLSSAKVSSLVQMSLGSVPLPRVDDSALELELTKLVATIKAGGKEARDNYDLLLVGETFDAAGILRGKATGTLTDGSKLRDVRFQLTPLTLDGKRIIVGQ